MLTRPPQPEDIERILSIDAVSEDNRWDKDGLYRYIGKEVGHRVFVVEADQLVIGFIAAEFPSEITESIIIRKLVIDQLYRLKGAGRELFRHIYYLARSRNYSKIEVIFDETNDGAIKFLKRVAHIEKSVAANGHYHFIISLNDSPMD